MLKTHRARLDTAFFLRYLLLAGIAASLVAVLTGGAQARLTQIASVALLIFLAILATTLPRDNEGRFQIFHPAAIPSLYVGFSLLAPLWYTSVTGTSVGSLARGEAISPRTQQLLVLAVASFFAGALIKTKADKARLPAVSSELTLVQLARVLLILGILLLIPSVLGGDVRSRGVDQLNYGIQNSVTSLVFILTMVGQMLLHATRARLGRRMTAVDFTLIIAAAALSGLTGRRSQVIAMVLLFLFFHWRRSGRVWGVTLGVFFAGAISLTILAYRSAGSSAAKSPIEALLGDMAVGAFTTGATVERVPYAWPYEQGSTLVAALIRQLPSPLANRFIGPPDDTGALVFRRLLGFSDSNQGFGFSLPAEGYLNFGVPGIVIVMFALGALTSFLYHRFDIDTMSAVTLSYPIVVAELPYLLRSDFLGAGKLILYQTVLIALVTGIAAFVAHRKTARLRRMTATRVPSRG